MTTYQKHDYYDLLELEHDCSQEDIAENYRRIAMYFHPKRVESKCAPGEEYHFELVAEAYEVLSDPIKRNIYDIYGFEGLNNGIVDKNGKIIGGYKYLGNGHEIFEKFMGTVNPFALLPDEKISPEVTVAIRDAFGKNKDSDKIEDYKPKSIPIIDIDLECSLEELYNGCVKTVNYKKKAITYDLRNTEEKEASVDVEVFRGYDKDTVIPFKEMGNDAPGEKSSDLVIHIREKKHPCFKRVNKNDLVYTHQITLAQAINSEPVRLTTLDNRKISVSVDEIISPNTVLTVIGEGMPIYQKDFSVRDLTVKKGNLYIKFDIKFPEFIDPIKKQEITSLLEGDE